MTAAMKIGSGLFAHDPRSVFFATPELTQRINLIHHLIAHSEQLLLVMAEEGRGKTTLMYQILGNAEEHWKVFVLESDPGLSADALVGRLLSMMNVRPEGKPSSTLRDNLRSHIAATRYNGQLPVLVVDDAHMLPLETLGLLVQLAMTGEPQTRMRILLFCEPQISSVFAAPEFEILRTTLIHTLDIPPFSEKQLGDYLNFSLRRGNFRGNNPFEGETLNELYRETEGVPGAVNQRARQVLNQQTGKFARLRPMNYFSTLGRRRGLYILLIALGVALLIVGAAWFKDYLLYQPPGQPRPLPLPSQTEGEGLQPDELEALPPSPPESRQSMQSLEESSGQLAPPPMPASPGRETSPDELAEPGPPPEEESFGPMDAATQAETGDPPEIGETEPESEPPTPGRLAQVYTETWLRQQEPELYTIQIMGAYDRDNLARLLRRHELPDGPQLAMFKSVYRNRDWFVLVYGLYPDRNHASQSIQALPRELRRNTQPWVRSLGSIQNELDRLD